VLHALLSALVGPGSALSTKTATDVVPAAFVTAIAGVAGVSGVQGLEAVPDLAFT
jgi:hypothetical protein